MNRILTAFVILLGCAAPAVSQQAHSPYAHQGAAEVKTLSQQEVDDLLAGAGMGMARPAELNGYPGPRHVLELADSLGLSPDQRQAVEEIFTDMREEAVAIGRQIVAAEQALDELFDSGDVSETGLVRGTARIGSLRSTLRAVHLRAHLRTRAVLTDDQVRAYDRLRGYDSRHEHSGHAGAAARAGRLAVANVPPRD